MRSHLRLIFQTCAGLFGLLSMVNKSSAQNGQNTTPAAGSVSQALAAVLKSHGYTQVALNPSSSGDGQYTVSVKLDTAAAELLFDSGFNGNITFHDDVLNVHGSPAGTVEGVAGTGTMDTLHLAQVSIGAMHFPSQAASISPFPTADGGLGANFISAHKAILDYANDALFLQEKPDAVIPANVIPPAGYMAIPLMHTVMADQARATYLINVVLDSTPILLLLDTGADGVIVDQQRADELHLPDEGKLSLGTLHLKVPFQRVDMSRIQQKAKTYGFPKFEGILGADILRDHGGIIDFANGVLYLREK